MSWIERWSQRQRELKEGADADLIRDNRRWDRLGLAAFALAFVFGWVATRFSSTGIARSIILGIAIALLVIGWLLLAYAKAERNFLREPDLEKPPSILEPRD